MEIKWLRNASKNLSKEAEFIYQQNSKASIQFVKKIRKTVELLAENPALGHTGRIHGTREIIIPKTNYIIPYRVNKKLNRIEIIRIFHTSRKPPKEW